MPSAPSSFALPFIKKIQHNAGTYSLYFDRSTYEFTFSPGQYVKMTLPHEDADERGTSRFFTIASSPNQAELVITTRMLQSTFKRTMLQLCFGVRWVCLHWMKTIEDP
jgi:ferredoxin-NADP reductase